MSQHPPVPRLDLAPKLKRPLSLWNPLDYMRLLYWVFYFPQALEWYVELFGGGLTPERGLNWLRGWKLLQQNITQRNLLFQGLVLTVVTPLILSWLLHVLGIYIDWSKVMIGTTLSVVAGITLGVGLSTATGVVLGVAFGVVLGVALGLTGGIATDAAGGVVIVVAAGMAYGLAFGVALGVTTGMEGGVALSVAGGLAFSAAFGVAFSVVLGSLFGMIGGVTFGVPFVVVGGIAVLRLESCAMGSLLNTAFLSNGSWLFSRITLLPLPHIGKRLQDWLQQDWETGLHNTNQLLAYTLQFIPVVQAANRILAITPQEEIIGRISRMAEAPFDWQLVRFASASLNNALISKSLSQLWFLPKRLWQGHFSTETRLDSPAHATAAGFWYLYEEQPTKAQVAFKEVKSLLYGEEMFALAQILALFKDAKDTASIVTLNLPAFPQEPLLRPATWKALTRLHRVIEDTKTVEQSISRATRSFALNRALGELRRVLDNANTLPQAERSLIIDIAQTWQTALLEVAGEVGEISITKPIANPYTIGDPVVGERFVGREDVMRELEELWITNHQVQSVVLYGHRRMGKTSILKNAANNLGSEIKLAYVNLLEVGDAPSGVGEVLIAITDAVSRVVNLQPPVDTELLNFPLPTFRRYLEQVIETLDQKSLIIALDEFEKIEDLIEAGKIPKDFLGYLRGLVQKSSQLAFTFAGLHTLEEMTADYFQPFFASVIPIHVGFQERAATHQILANPDQDFLLDYNREALDRIYDFTHGQPFLVQLVGFQLVRHYNDYVFQQGRWRSPPKVSRNPVFTVEDVETVINDPEFFKRGRYYFDGVWGQAARGSAGQQAILRAITPHLQGLSFDALRECTGIDNLTLQEALKTLKRHDVVEEIDGSWRITVELFRRWVCERVDKG